MPKTISTNEAAPPTPSRVGVHPVTASGQNLVNQALAGSSGRQMSGTSPLMRGFSGAVFFQIDPAEGPTVIGQLKPK